MLSPTANSTLELDQAAASSWDIAIVGAGPAGALAARQAARAGASVLLVDKASFPRWKVCGCCLNAAALSVLESVGLSELLNGLGARPIEKIRLTAKGRVAECWLPGGVSLSREALDTALVESAIAAGAQFLPQTEATLAPRTDKQPCLSAKNRQDATSTKLRVLRLRQGRETAIVGVRVVLAADGLAGKLTHGEPELRVRTAPASRLGAGTVLEEASAFFDEGVISMASGRGGYVGLVRLENGRLEVAAALDRESVRRRGGPGRLAVAILQEARVPVPTGLEAAAWRGTPPLTRRPARLFAERMLVLGDAAGYVEPFTGEGMAWALASGAAVAPLAVAGAEDWRSSVGLAWEQRHRRLIGRRQRACRWVSRLLRHPHLCAAAVTALRHAPQLAAPLVRAINRPFELEIAHLAAPHRGARRQELEVGG